MSLPFDPKGVHTGRGWNIINTHVHLFNCFHRWYCTRFWSLWAFVMGLRRSNFENMQSKQLKLFIIELFRFFSPLNRTPAAIVNCKTLVRFCYIVWIALQLHRVSVCVELLRIFQSLFKTLNYFFHFTAETIRNYDIGADYIVCVDKNKA